MTNWTRRQREWRARVRAWRAAGGVVVAAVTLAGCYYPSPYQDEVVTEGPVSPPLVYAPAPVVREAPPPPVFQYPDGTVVYYSAVYNSYVYRDEGYYYRWTGAGWVYTTVWWGGWAPLAAGVYLPPRLIYGPPPPVPTYRPYFIWWRAQVGPWYQVNHPHWWVRHEPYLGDYDAWRDHGARYYGDRPDDHPDMRPVFRGPGRDDRRVPNWDRGGHDGGRFRGQPWRAPEARPAPVSPTPVPLGYQIYSGGGARPGGPVERPFAARSPAAPGMFPPHGPRVGDGRGPGAGRPPGAGEPFRPGSAGRHDPRDGRRVRQDRRRQDCPDGDCRH